MIESENREIGLGTDNRGMTLVLGRLYFPELAPRGLLNPQHLVCDIDKSSHTQVGVCMHRESLCAHMVPLGEMEGSQELITMPRHTRESAKLHSCRGLDMFSFLILPL